MPGDGAHAGSCAVGDHTELAREGLAAGGQANTDLSTAGGLAGARRAARPGSPAPSPGLMVGTSVPAAPASSTGRAAWPPCSRLVDAGGLSVSGPWVASAIGARPRRAGRRDRLAARRPWPRCLRGAGTLPRVDSSMSPPVSVLKATSRPWIDELRMSKPRTSLLRMSNVRRVLLRTSPLADRVVVDLAAVDGAGGDARRRRRRATRTGRCRRSRAQARTPARMTSLGMLLRDGCVLRPETR